MIIEPTKICIDRMQALGIGILASGRFFDENSQCVLHDNHMRCILKNDTGLPASMIKTSMDWMKRNVAAAVKANNHLTQDVTVKGTL
jgi:hypothetical protein